jgi:hypothetical protein
MKKLLGILVLGLLWCNVGFAEIIHLKCKGMKGIGDYASNSSNNLFEYKIDTQKKTFEMLLPSRSDNWESLNVLEWQDKSIKSVSGDFIEIFNWVTYRATFVDVPQYKNGYMQFDCNDFVIQMKREIEPLKVMCRNIGYSDGTEKFADCVKDLYLKKLDAENQAQSQTTTTTSKPKRRIDPSVWDDILKLGGISSGSTSSSSSISCFKINERTSGTNKICSYNCMGSEVTRNIKSTQICPMSIKN